MGARLLSSSRGGGLCAGVAVGVLYVCAAVLDDLGLALEELALAFGLGLAFERAAGALVLLEGHGWLDGFGVEGGFALDGLVDGLGGVDDFWLDDFALENGLDDLVDVVVAVFFGGDGALLGALGGGVDGGGGLELGLLGGEL